MRFARYLYATIILTTVQLLVCVQIAHASTYSKYRHHLRGTASLSSAAQPNTDQPAKNATTLTSALTPQQQMLAYALTGNFTAFKHCIDTGVDINTKRGDGCNALMLAAQSANQSGSIPNAVDIAQYLITQKVDVNAVNSAGNSALMIAAQAGNVHMVHLLFHSGADLEKSNNLGATALMLAAQSKRNGAVSELLNEGADEDAADSFNNTSLIFAAENDAPGVVLELIKVGTDLDVKNSANLTALDEADAKNFQDVILLLNGAGAR